MKDEYVANWLKKADNDLKVAKNELCVTDGDVITEAICFHSQQAVEKYLKAYLISNEIEFGKTHNLEYLIELCSRFDSDFCSMDVEDLSFYAVEIRYPDNFYIPSVEEANRSYHIACKIKDFMVDKLHKHDS